MVRRRLPDLHGSVARAKANKAQLTIEANGHRVEFRHGSPHDERNRGLHADATLPNYPEIGKMALSYTKILEIMKGNEKP